MIKDLLIQITDGFGFKQVEVAKLMGVSPTYISSVINGKLNAGKQFLAGLLLLKEVIVLRKQLAGLNPDLVKELATMKARIIKIETSVSTQYPEHVPNAMLLNEPNSPGEASDVKAAVKAALAAASGEKTDAAPKK